MSSIEIPFFETPNKASISEIQILVTQPAFIWLIRDADHNLVVGLIVQRDAGFICAVDNTHTRAIVLKQIIAQILSIL